MKNKKSIIIIASITTLTLLITIIILSNILLKKDINNNEITKQNIDIYISNENVKYNQNATNSYVTNIGFSIKNINNETKDLILVKNKKNNKNNIKYICKSIDNIYNLDLTNLENGKYYMNDINIDTNTLTNVARFKLNDKLIDVNLKEKYIEIANFKYEYDILIDVGHGGKDTGAVNSYMTEKELNLIVSNYEKKRYEDHGLKVKILRTSNDDYGEMIKEEEMANLSNKAYTIGHYGVVSKVVYSNHHNAAGKRQLDGYEIIVSGKLSKKQYENELNIVNKFNKLYNLTTNQQRFYTRNIEESPKEGYDMRNNQRYDFRDYYAVVRVPIELFNVKSVIYEGCYMDNEKDFKWYYLDKNYIKVSEIKIKQYVESLGVEYKEI